ncbi:MAG: hypothetical protein ABIQ02_11055 [Saprospiraceae bacterium]
MRRPNQKFLSCLSNLAIVIIAILFLNQCTPSIPKTKGNPHTSVNSSHLDSLYEERKVEGREVGIVHIYSAYPDYHWVGDNDEGIACVDDASRAAIFYLREYQRTSFKADLHKATMLLNFLMTMQAKNGYFYNFIWPDGSINKTGITSQAVPIWWSWRTLWCFGETIDILGIKNKTAKQVLQHRDLLLQAILHEKSLFSTKTDTAAGFTIPMWLPNDGATDQSAIMILGLSAAFKQNVYKDNQGKRDSIKWLINHLADGIMMLQVEAPGNFYDGAFLSWQNLWHAYGNVQSYALLSAGQILNDPHMQAHAFYEINTFYPAVYERGYMDSFWIRSKKGKTSAYDLKTVPQIAYGIRPMVFACMKAYDITGDTKYKVRAEQLASWFSGKNIAHTPMYNPSDGIGFDGLSGPGQINRNSGAESTIEALLTMQSLEQITTKK